jgi:hypothetical protein
VNNVVLYLGGSGTVSFSIGTSFQGTQVLGATNVVVGSTIGWYSTTFANVTLSAGTDYFLNVNLVSGSTQWGYTSSTSTSVDTGALQDYWYSGSTLTHENSHRGSQTLGTTDVTVGSSTGWVKVFFNDVTLTAGTDYFLNVNLVSGSTQWGYTSSPSVDTGALQDFWYSGSTLYHDNSYPDIFSIGYNTQSTAAILGQMFSDNTMSGVSLPNIF